MQRRGLLWWLVIGWWWAPACWFGRVLLWLVAWPLGLWRSYRHGQRQQARARGEADPMGSDFHIDVAELRMFSGYTWLPFGPEITTTDCPHNARSVIGWGPAIAQYELEQCDLCGARGWVDGRWQQERDRGEPHGFWAKQMRWYEAMPVPHDFTPSGDEPRTCTCGESPDHPYHQA